MKKMITPFSCGSEAFDWLSNNCEQCKKAYRPRTGEPYLPDFDETKQLVEQGRECKLKFDIDFAFLSGKIPLETAQQIGYKDGSLNQSCMMMIDNNRFGFDGDDIKPIDDIPDNQLCLPFAMDEIINSNVGQEKLIIENEHS